MSQILAVYCVDVGSVQAGNLGWAHIDYASGSERSGDGIGELVEEASRDLLKGPVAIGFECPLYVPLPKAVSEIGKARPGEGNRSWLASGGAGALAIGAVEVPWILRGLRAKAPDMRGFVDWMEFSEQASGFLVWEAMVTGETKTQTHVGDALVGARAFCRVAKHPPLQSALDEDEEVFSLVGAAMLRTGWTHDAAVLRHPCLVVKAEVEDKDPES